MPLENCSSQPKSPDFPVWLLLAIAGCCPGRPIRGHYVPENKAFRAAASNENPLLVE